MDHDQGNFTFGMDKGNRQFLPSSYYHTLAARKKEKEANLCAIREILGIASFNSAYWGCWPTASPNTEQGKKSYSNIP